MRLQKYLANAGVASRRACEQYIKDGLVTINGVIAEVGVSVEEGDVVEYNGKVIKLEETKEYYLLFKPVGYITTSKDDRGRKTVLDLVETKTRVYPVGRLDVNTSGLLLLTNDGELANRLTHPSFEVEKTYNALIEGEIDEKALESLRNGVVLEDGLTRPAKVKLIKTEGRKSYVAIAIHEGKNRQVRRMFEAVGHRVLSLRRVKVGNISLKGMEKGQIRPLTDDEVAYLKRICQL